MRLCGVADTVVCAVSFPVADIFWDTILRWYGDVRVPSRMWVDLLCVALDECTHFEWINARMQELGYGYGDMPAHHGLWEEACESSGSLLDRLIQVPLQQEARALDAQPRLVSKLLSCGDRTSAELVNQICSEEVSSSTLGHPCRPHISPRSARVLC